MTTKDTLRSRFEESPVASFLSSKDKDMVYQWFTSELREEVELVMEEEIGRARGLSEAAELGLETAKDAIIERLK